MAEHEALEQAKAEVDSQLADVLSTSAELAALKDELEASLASTKATLQTSEENLVAAQVSDFGVSDLTESHIVFQVVLVACMHACMLQCA